MVVHDQMPTPYKDNLLQAIRHCYWHSFDMLSQKFLVIELNIVKKDMIYTFLSRFSAFAVQIRRASMATVRKIVALYIKCIKFYNREIPYVVDNLAFSKQLI